MRHLRHFFPGSSDDVRSASVAWNLGARRWVALIPSLGVSRPFPPRDFRHCCPLLDGEQVLCRARQVHRCAGCDGCAGCGAVHRCIGVRVRCPGARVRRGTPVWRPRCAAQQARPHVLRHRLTERHLYCPVPMWSATLCTQHSHRTQHVAPHSARRTSHPALRTTAPVHRTAPSAPDALSAPVAPVSKTRTEYRMTERKESPYPLATQRRLADPRVGRRRARCRSGSRSYG